MRLTLRQFQYFVAIVDAGSMSHAAEVLNVTPTSLSLQMKQLEDVLHANLLRRHSRGVTPTEQGAAFYEKAQEIVTLVEDTEHAFMVGAPPETRTLRVGVPPAVARTVGIEVMTRRMEGVKLALYESWANELMPKLASNLLDFVIAYDIRASDGIEVLNFHEEEFVFFCTPGLVPEGSIVDLHFAMDSGLVFYGQNSISWRAITEVAAAEGIEFNTAREVQSIHVWRAMVTRGLGTSIAPIGTLYEEAMRGEVSVHRLRDAPIVRKIGMAARKEMLDFGREIGVVDFVAKLIDRAQPDFGNRATRCTRRKVPPVGVPE